MGSAIRSAPTKGNKMKNLIALVLIGISLSPVAHAKVTATDVKAVCARFGPIGAVSYQIRVAGGDAPDAIVHDTVGDPYGKLMGELANYAMSYGYQASDTRDARTVPVQHCKNELKRLYGIGK